MSGLDQSAVVDDGPTALGILELEEAGSRQGLPTVFPLDGPGEGVVPITHPGRFLVAPFVGESPHSIDEGIEQQVG